MFSPPLEYNERVIILIFHTNETTSIIELALIYLQREILLTVISLKILYYGTIFFFLNNVI